MATIDAFDDVALTRAGPASTRLAWIVLTGYLNVLKRGWREVVGAESVVREAAEEVTAAGYAGVAVTRRINETLRRIRGDDWSGQSQRDIFGELDEVNVGVANFVRVLWLQARSLSIAQQALLTGQVAVRRVMQDFLRDANALLTSVGSGEFENRNQAMALGNRAYVAAREALDKQSTAMRQVEDELRGLQPKVRF